MPPDSLLSIAALDLLAILGFALFLIRARRPY
jgi:hypothetical protein